MRAVGSTGEGASVRVQGGVQGDGARGAGGKTEGGWRCGDAARQPAQGNFYGALISRGGGDVDLDIVRGAGKSGQGILGQRDREGSGLCCRVRGEQKDEQERDELQDAM